VYSICHQFADIDQPLVIEDDAWRCAI